MRHTFFTLALLALLAAPAAAQSAQGGVVVRGGVLIGPPSDTTAPVLSVFTCGTPAETSATCTWNTDEPATSEIEWGLTVAYGNSDSDAALTTGPPARGFLLTGLTGSTTYHWRARSCDAAGNCSAFSADQTFITAASGGSATNPTCGSTDTTTNFIPDARYQSFITGGGGITCAAGTCTVTTTGNHDLTTGETVRISGTSLADTDKGGGEVVTVTSPTTFTFPDGASGSATVGFVTWIPVVSALGTWTDPSFGGAGCTFTRMGNFENSTAEFSPVYSTYWHYSPDETKVLSKTPGVGTFQVRNRADWSVYASGATLGNLNDGNSPRWLNDNELLFISGRKLRKVNITTGTPSDVHDFTGCNSGSITVGATGDLDDARDKIALRCTATTGGNDYFVYTVSTDSLSTPYHSTKGADFQYITADGNFLIFWGSTGVGTEDGTQLINGATGARIHQVTNVSPHGLPGVDTAGVPVLYMADNGMTGSPCSGGFVAVDINTPANKVCMLAVTNVGRAVHLSTTSGLGTNPGWALYSILDSRSSAGATARTVPNLTTLYAANWIVKYNEVGSCQVTISTVTSTCYRFGHPYSRDANASSAILDAAMYGNISPNGRFFHIRTTLGLCDGGTPTGNCSPSNDRFTETAMSQIRP